MRVTRFLPLAACVLAGSALVVSVGCETKTEAQRRLIAKGGAAGASGTGAGPTEADDGTDGNETTSSAAGGFGDGVVKGRVVLEGNFPEPKSLARAIKAKAECVRARETNELPEILNEKTQVGPEGGLANCIVYIRKAPGRYGAEDFKAYGHQDPVVVDQIGCQYVPHIFPVHPSQTVRIKNSDPFLHNVQTSTISGFNETYQDIETRDYPAMFSKSPRPGPKDFSCSVHTWMSAFAFVIPHPFFSLTKADGSFEISKLPNGSYELAVWHEDDRKLTLPKWTNAVASFTVTDGTAEPAEIEIKIPSKY